MLNLYSSLVAINAHAYIYRGWTKSWGEGGGGVAYPKINVLVLGEGVGGGHCARTREIIGTVHVVG